MKELPQKAALPLAANEAYKGQAFEKNAVEWMVPDVLWNKEDEEVVVHYYDRAGAAREGLSEEKIGDPIGMNEYCDCMERMDVSEIRQWVKGGATDVDGVPAFEEHEGGDGEDDSGWSRCFRVLDVKKELNIYSWPHTHPIRGATLS